jgi:hypothetical protein
MHHEIRGLTGGCRTAGGGLVEGCKDTFSMSRVGQESAKMETT